MAKTTSKTNITLECQVAQNVGYVNYQSNLPLFRRFYIRNTSDVEVRDVEIEIKSDFTLPLTIKQELLPPKTTVNFSPAVCLSPSYFVTLSESLQSEVEVVVRGDGKLIGTLNLPVTLMGYRQFFGTSAQAELLAAFVSDRAPITTKIVKAAEAVLKKWHLKITPGSYKNLDNNEARFVAAAVYAAIQDLAIAENKEPQSLEFPVEIAEQSAVVESKKATPAEMAILTASALRAAGLNPIIISAENEMYLASWLTDRCFNEALVDDLGQLIRRVGEGVNEIAVFNIASLYDGKNVNFQASEKDALRRISQAKKFDFILDIKRARVGGIKALPERIQTKQGWQVVDEENFDTSKAPEAIKTYGSVDLSVEGSREKQWERRLLDLSQKNSLLNFKESSSVHLMISDIAEMLNALSSGVAYNVSEAPQELAKILSEVRSFETNINVNPLPELISIELKNKRIHSFYPAKKLETAVTNLYRKERTFVEETGAYSLFIAAGFLKWYANEDKLPKYAPIILIPVTLTKDGVRKGFRVKLREEDISINTTLLEYLKQEFGLDLRGLANFADEKPDVQQILSLIKNEVMALPGWNIANDVYLSSLTFSRYMMWHDVKYRIADIRKHPVVKSIITGKGMKGVEVSKHANPDSVYTSDKVYLPINADSSQFAAIVDCTKMSFVLHGPPGTGKSQTITNMIASSLARGKRVLFVAEKMAALSVVKNRLTEIGIQDFCLELHSNKANKVEIAERIQETLKLAENAPAGAFAKKAEEIAALTAELNEINSAMHRERRLGISVYEGVVRYLEYQNAPDLLEIDNSFYERLNADLLQNYEDTLSEMAACASEFGDVRKTPFRNVELLESSAKWRARAERVLQLFLEQLPHTRRVTEICLDELGTKVRKLSKKRLTALYKLAQILTESGSDISDLLASENLSASIKLLEDYKEILEKYNQVMIRYKADFIELPDGINYDILQIELEKPEPDRKVANNVMKRLDRVKKHTLSKDKRMYYMKLVLLAHTLRESLEKKSNQISKIVSGGADLSPDKIMKLIGSFSVMYQLAEEIYADFDKGAFHSVVNEIASNETYDVLHVFMNSYRMMLQSEQSFKKLFAYTGDLEGLDEDYFDYMSKKLNTILDNLYLMPSWVKFNTLSKRCNEEGLSFAVKALTEGKLKGEDLIRCFRKRVYQNFVETEVALDERLNDFSAASTEELIDKFRRFNDEFAELTKKEIYAKLCANLQKETDELALENLVLQRAAKSRMKGMTLRKLFQEIPGIMKIAAPCLLMSPISVAQYLEITDDKFDLVVFDEASQVPTAEAVGAIARGETTVIVGDPNQLPPTSFFVSDYVDEDNLDDEDLESVLDETIAIGLPEHHLNWHYRSKHESLISFSNAMYYDNKLLTFPSPNELSSKVHFHYVEGIYDRGGAKTNDEEAKALVAAVVEKLKDPLDNSSIGIVTFSSAQRSLIEDKLSAAIIKNKLETRAYASEEPLFIKNLENVQGDERDIIYFSVGYGPDKYCRLSLNFGPLNKQGGFRRLNVAVTRAKSEMHMFSSITSDMIDLNKTTSKGVFGLKAFLEFADKGRTMLAVDASDIRNDQKTIGWHIAEELKKEGIKCECNVGDSGFKIDVGVIAPAGDRYILGILCDSKHAGEVQSVRDKYVLEVKTLKQLGWNIYRMWTVNFLQNPKREIKRVKAYIERITALSSGKAKALPDTLTGKYRREYKSNVLVKPLVKGGPEFVTNIKNEKLIQQKAESIILSEQPISKNLLLKKLCVIYSINKTHKAYEKLKEILEVFKDKEVEYGDNVFYETPDSVTYDYFRPRNDGAGKRLLTEVHPSEFIAAARCVVAKYVSVDKADLINEAAKLLGFGKPSPENAEYINQAIDLGVKKGLFLVALDNKITF